METPTSNAGPQQPPVQQAPTPQAPAPQAQPQQRTTPPRPILSGPPEGESSAQRLKTACSHCRQQKIKCRTNDDLSTPCERCSKMKLTCVYEPRHSRGRPRSESETFERGEVKRRLVAKDELAGAPSSGGSYRPFVAINTPSSVVAETPPRKSSYTSPVSTIERSIDGLKLEPEVIDNLFGQFFRFYHPFLPILDPGLRPNEYYAQSSFLFWSILAVASRRWPKDPTLMPALRSRVLGHAMTTIFSPTAGTSTITAVLLLLSWSFPETQNYDEVPYVFSSALVHAAMRIGMNTPDCTQDFSRVKITISDVECKRRFQIWAYCLVLYQRSSCCMGNNFGQFPTYLSKETQKYVAALPPSLYFQMDIQDIVARATVAIANNGLELTNQVQRVAFDGILQTYMTELQLCETRQSAPVLPLEKLYLSISRLMLKAFHFFKVPMSSYLHDLRPAFDAALTLVHQLNDLEKTLHVDLYGTSYVFHGAVLGACVLLRCLKTPFVDLVPEQASTGQALFFSAINMLRNISLKPHHVNLTEMDKPMKSSVVLQGLWRSETIFKHEDGSWNLDLRVRSRFATSVLYDIMWWGREELQGQSNAYPKKSAPPLTPAWSGSEPLFQPDLFADMAFTQDWILNDWEANPAGLAPILNPMEPIAYHPR